MHITYNREEFIYEVPVTRAQFKMLIERSAGDTHDSMTQRMYQGLVVVAREGQRVLAGTTKYTEAGCGCPAIMAQVMDGTDYEEAYLGVEAGNFPGHFDSMVQAFLTGALTAGATADTRSFVEGHELEFRPSNTVRLIVTEESA